MNVQIKLNYKIIQIVHRRKKTTVARMKSMIQMHRVYSIYGCYSVIHLKNSEKLMRFYAAGLWYNNTCIMYMNYINIYVCVSMTCGMARKWNKKYWYSGGDRLRMSICIKYMGLFVVLSVISCNWFFTKSTPQLNQWKDYEHIICVCMTEILSLLSSFWCRRIAVINNFTFLNYFAFSLVAWITDILSNVFFLFFSLIFQYTFKCVWADFFISSRNVQSRRKRRSALMDTFRILKTKHGKKLNLEMF